VFGAVDMDAGAQASISFGGALDVDTMRPVPSTGTVSCVCAAIQKEFQPSRGAVLLAGEVDAGLARQTRRAASVGSPMTVQRALAWSEGQDGLWCNSPAKEQGAQVGIARRVETVPPSRTAPWARNRTPETCQGTVRDPQRRTVIFVLGRVVRSCPCRMIVRRSQGCSRPKGADEGVAARGMRCTPSGQGQGHVGQSRFGTKPRSCPCRR
jgi:hypothetical protein